MSDDEAARMDADIKSDYSWAQKPAPDYELASLRGKIKRVQARLNEYDKLHDQSQNNTAESAAGFNGVKIVRNVEENRLQLLFDEKPDEETRAKLKSNGFRWSPRNKAWQRQLTDNAERAAKIVLESI